MERQPEGGTLLLVTENHAWGGAAIYLRELILAVRPLYKRVVIVSNHGGLMVGDIPSTILNLEGVEYEEISYLSTGAVWRSLSGISGKLALSTMWLVRRVSVANRVVASRLVRKYRPDAVFCANHGSQQFIWSMMSLCGHRKIPAATYMLGMPDAFESMPERIQRIRDYRMWRACHFVIVNASAVGRAMTEQRELPHSKVRVIPNGIPSVPQPLERSTKGRTLRVGTLGRLSHLKGVDDLLKATALMVPRYDLLELAIAGEGKESDALRAVADDLGIRERTQFLGFVPDAEAHEFLQSLDVFVLASLTEGLPFSVMEAMRAGLPIVATRVGGVPEMIEDGVSGMLVDPGDPQGIADAVAAIVDDPALAARLGEAARRRFDQRYTTDVMYNAIRKAFVDGGLV